MRGEVPRSVLVVGAVRSGVAAAEALARHGARVRLHDRRDDLRPGVPHAVELALGDVEPAALLAGVDVVVKSPGVPAASPVIAAAVADGVPVWGEIELGYRLLPDEARVVGITGTNGKTTTTELAGAMLRAAGVATFVAGNVGTALTGVAPTMSPHGVVVCELSSFQLEDVRTLRCAAAAMLNLPPDHLDRHGTMAAYGEAKLRIFERQEPGDVAVLNADDPWTRALTSLPGRADVIRVGAADADRLGFAASRLRGDHNRENVAVAAALARAVGADDASITAALAAFAPVPHRLEHVGDAGGVSFWNDSKATNVDATLKALTAFPEGRLRLILGGSDKGADFAALGAALAGVARSVYLVGPAGARLRTLLDPVVQTRWCGTLEPALDAAIADAEPGDAVLLAPACASFDEFASYAERGDTFRALAHARGVA
jgi:UDP-N-acetylmuramoylalanine--D-glutamate ligase